MKAKIKLKNKEIVIEDIKRCGSGWDKFKGLMFRNKEKANALLFDFDKDTRQGIHSYFVGFSFLAIWLDENNKIAEYKVVEPYTALIKPEKNFRKLIEVPINEKYNGVIQSFLGKEKDLNTTSS